MKKNEGGTMDELVDLAAERLVLAGVFRHGEEVYLDIADIVKPNTFTDDSNRTIWKCLQHLYEEKGAKSFDQASVQAAASELGYHHLIDRPEEIKHLASIFHTRVDRANVVTWGAKLRKLQITRYLRERLQDADVQLSDLKGTEPIEQILGLAEDAVLNFSYLDDDEARVTHKLSNGVDEWLNHVMSNPTDMVGISTGWKLYDYAIGGGCRRGTISLMGARPKSGKSMTALNVAINVALNNTPVLLLDTEMKDEDHWPRALSCISRRNGADATITAIETGKFTKSILNTHKVQEAKKKLHTLPLHYRSVVGMSAEEIMPLIRRWIHKEVGYHDNGRLKDCLVIYDYIKLQNADQLGDDLKEYQALGFLMTALHNFVARFDIPMLAFVQLNRDGETQETGSSFAQSDRILWLVTNYSIFKAKSADENISGTLSDGNRKIVPIAARHGEGLREGDFINMHFQGKYALITEGDTRDNIQQRQIDQQREATELSTGVGSNDDGKK
jgi:replicative DNA helicase